MPWRIVRDVLDNLPVIEFRRQYPIALIASMIAPSVGVKHAQLLDFFPAWARVPEHRDMPESLRADLRVGLRLNLVSQDLYDYTEG